MFRSRVVITASVLAAAAFIGGCSDPTDATRREPVVIGASSSRTASTSSVTVSGTVPADAPQSTTLDVTINGSGFDQGANATFPLNGANDPRVHVNSTRFVKSTQLVANVTIAPDAPAVKYDVAVLDRSGKKGIGTEMFTVDVAPEPLPGGTIAYGVNVNGDAVGYVAGTGSCGATNIPILWKADGTRVVLPTGSYCGATAWAINRYGYISGQLFGPPGTALWVPQPDGTYVLQDLGPTPEGTLARNTGALNDAGEILGWYNNAQIYWRTPTTGWTHMTAPPGALECAFARGINDRGEIVGRCDDGHSLDAFYWADHSAVPVRLPRPPGSTAPVFAQEINDSGVIVGYISSNPYHALRWTPSGSTYPTVELLPDAGKGSEAYGIASDGTIAGSFQNGTLRAVMWSSSGSYAFLAFTQSSNSGQAYDVAVKDVGGLVLAGNQSTGALRWKTGF